MTSSASNRTACKPSKARQDREALAKAVDRVATLAAIIDTAAEEGPAVSDALHRAAAKVARMTPVERWVASTPPKVPDAISGPEWDQWRGLRGDPSVARRRQP